MTTLRLLPIPRKWWTLQNHVKNCRWSRMLIKFRTMNAGLGNRDSFRTADSISQDGGCVLQCPLCFQGSNDKFHPLMKCPLMDQARSEIKLRDTKTKSLKSTLLDLRSRSIDEFEAVRLFPGQDKSVTKKDLMDRGLVLDILVNKFFLIWSEIRGRAVTQQTTAQ